MSVSLGIDVAKDTFDAVLIDQNGKNPKHWHLERTLEGLEQLKDLLSAENVDFESLSVGMEATNSYWKLIATAVVGWKAKCFVINPVVICNFRKVVMEKQKNDRRDALIIAKYTKMHAEDPWTPSSSGLAQITELTRRIVDLKRLSTQEKCRLTSEPSEIIAKSINRVLDAIRDEVKLILKELKEAVAKDEEINEMVDCAVSIPGIGFQTAVTLLGELGNLKRFDNAKTVASYAGLVPREFQSGTSVNKKPELTSYGNRNIRRCLYMAAMAAIRVDSEFRAFYLRLREDDKKPKVALVAVMHKLLRVFFGVVKSRKCYQDELAAPKNVRTKQNTT